MDSKVKPIPAFYCCYLLRSTVRHASLYVGSSPHPSRRLAQHNGKAKGGAVRTSRLSLRPWEMACVVAGFPSNIAALQFEWAWQNSHLSRHILPEERISFPVTITKTNRKTGKTRNKPGRPRTSLVERLSNLHLLLRTKYFSQWPLELRFFSADVYRAWQSWCGRVDTQVRPEIKVVLDLPPSEVMDDEDTFSSAQRSAKRRKIDLIGKGGVEGVDPTYARYQTVLEKSHFLLDEDEIHSCAVCAEQIDISTDLFTLCTSHDCTSMSHVTCLAEHFLRNSGSASIVPASGCCPSCKTAVKWMELMRMVSLRIRGDREVHKLMRKKQKTRAATAVELMENNDDDDHVDDNDDSADDNNETITGTDHLPPDGLSEEEDDDDVDNLSVLSVNSLLSVDQQERTPPGLSQAKDRVEIVIEDSEDER